MWNATRGKTGKKKKIKQRLYYRNNYDKLEKEILDYIRKVCILNTNSETYKKVILKKKNDNTEVVNDYLSHIKVLEEKIASLNKKVEQIYDDRLNRCN